MGLLVAAAIVIVLIILISVGLFFYLGSRKPVDSITVTPAPSTSSPTPVTSPVPAPTTSSAPTVAEVRIPDPPPSVSSTTVDPVRTPEPPAAPVIVAPPPPPPQVAGLTLNSNYPIKVDLGTYFTPSGAVINAGGGSPVGWKIQAGSQAGTVRLQAPDGRYATYCNRCNPSIVKADQVTLTADASAASDWVPVRAADGSYGFSNAGRFMTRCNGCGVVPNSITAHETGANGWSSSFRLG